MVSHRALVLPLVSLFLGAASKFTPTIECPLLGPNLPANFDPSNTAAICDAKSSFPELVESLFSSGVVNRTHSTFAVDVFSTVTNSSIYSYYHAGPGLNGTLPTGKVDDQTIFRIGSVSKIFTAYAILAKAGIEVFDHPVTDYLPELAGNPPNDPLGKIRWEDITVGALASQQGGSGGMPIEAIQCLIPPSSGCTEQDLFTPLRNRNPILPPFQTAIYSDGGYGLLGRVLVRLTGLPYNEAVQSVLGAPLGLNSTSSMKPAGEKVNGAVIPGVPGVDTAWGYDNQITASSGGIYSSCEDLRKTGLSILHSQLLPPTTTRTWLKPRSGTAALTLSIGAPWEINRLTIPVSLNSNRTRVSDLYTKLGGQPQYSAVLALSPDHGIGYSILIAGPGAIPQRIPLRDLVGEVFLPAAEHAAAENAARNLAGTFASNTTKGSNLTLTVDEGHPGLGLKSFFLDGVEVRSNLVGVGIEIPAANLTVRLYPTGLVSTSDSTSAAYAIKGALSASFRAVAEVLPVGSRAAVEGGKGLFDDGCNSWSNAGFYGSLDEFVFNMVDGRLESVEYRLLGIVMRRVD